MNLWYVVGLFAAIALVGMFLWLRGLRSKKMEEKPQPKAKP